MHRLSNSVRLKCTWKLRISQSPSQCYYLMLHPVGSADLPIDWINNGRGIRDVTHRFVDCFEALSLDFGCCHLGFLEPEVTIFGKEGGAKGDVFSHFNEGKAAEVCVATHRFCPVTQSLPC